MSIPDFTLLIAVDREHLAELGRSLPTWARHKPGLLENPMVAVIDRDDPTLASDFVGLFGGPRMTLVRTGMRPAASQREKMLAGFVLDGPRHVETPYYFKLDCDTIATPAGPQNWIDPAWFDDSPAFIAPPWHYSKPGIMLDRLDDWSAGIPSLVDKPNPPRRHVGSIAKHKRMISYCMFGNTAWTREVAALCDDRLPVPSQDTLLSYVAERSGKLWRTAKMPGWKHVGGGGLRLKVVAEATMKEEQVTA